MLRKLFGFLFLAITHGWLAQAVAHQHKASRPNVIYGTDDRQLWPARPAAIAADWGQSVAIKVNRWKLFWDQDQNQWSLFGNFAGTQFQLCPEEAFAQELTIGTCTGFLVGPKLIATAGHCFKNISDCEKSSWIFGYEANQMRSSEHERKLIFSADQVYHCQQILLQEDTIQGKGLRSKDKLNNDFALIELDRPVVNRNPLTLASDSLLEQLADPEQSLNQAVVLMGHGLGLPLISGTGHIREVKGQASSTPILVVNTDSYTGNSGSPVFVQAQVPGQAPASAVVFGILFDGENDFESDPVRGCRKSQVCSETDTSSCQGEYVQSIAPIKHYLRILK